MVAQFLSQTDYAEHQHVSKQMVTRWKQKGLVSFGENGLVNVQATDKRLRDYYGTVTRVRNGVTRHIPG